MTKFGKKPIVVEAEQYAELVERCAATVHRAYCDNYKERKGEAYWTHGDYDSLDEETKEIDRATVRAVLKEVGYEPVEEDTP